MQSDKLLSEWPALAEKWKAINPKMPKPAFNKECQVEYDLATLAVKARVHLSNRNFWKMIHILSLDKFIEYAFNFKDPRYREAQWYSMLGYQLDKYNYFKSPKRTSEDSREFQYFNMISLLRTGFRGKSQQIVFKEEYLQFPLAKEWIAQECQPKYTVVEWKKFIKACRQKDGTYVRPIKSKLDPKKTEMSSLLKNIRSDFMENPGCVDEKVFELPMAIKWIVTSQYPHLRSSRG